MKRTSTINAIENASRAFLGLAGVLLATAAMNRFIIAATDSQILALPDPILGIPIRYSVVGVGLAELLVGLICLFGKSVSTRSLLLAWLMTIWVVYQAAMLYQGINIRCTCLGILTDPLRLAHGLLGRVTEFLPVCLLVGAYVAMAVIWMNRPRHKRNFQKVVCPGCGGRIEFPAEVIGWKIECPHCGGGVRLQNLPRIA